MRIWSLVIAPLLFPITGCSASEAASEDHPESATSGAPAGESAPLDDEAIQATSQESSEKAEASPDGAQEATDDALFRAAGFAPTTRGWEKCGDPGSIAYAPAEITQRGDFNEDGRPDALIYEGSTACAGMTGNIYTLLSQQADGTWGIVDERIGLPRFLATKGAGGWPDIEVGGPGFCFPVLRWNGREYTVDRREYEGKPCS